MKKLFMIMCLLFTISAHAQFYSDSEISISVGIFSDYSELNSMKELSGKDVSWSVTGTEDAAHPIMTIPIDSKILAIGFERDWSTPLYLIKSSQYEPFMQAWAQLEALAGFTRQVDYSKVFYNTDYQSVYIPFVSGYGGLIYAIIVNVSQESAIAEISTDTHAESTQYYNIKGQPIEEDAKGQVIIKTEGNKVSKYINR